MAEITEQAERELVRRAVMPSAAAVLAALVIGWAVAGPAVGLSAAIGIAIVFANFAAHGLSLAWAARVSIVAVQVVALAGFVVRLGAIVAAMFALNALSWFSPLAFGLAVVPATLTLLIYEARLALRGMGGMLQIPADPAAARAAQALAAREAR